jgi:PBSX family phage terminase large subunit
MMKMSRKRNKNAAFKFKPFSKKQKKLLTWWSDNSPHKDKDMIIADGSIRSGKTVAMIDSFTNWSLDTYSNENFIISGKSMGALDRNVINPWKQMLIAKGIKYNHVRSDDPRMEIGTNIYYLFGANNKSSQDTLQGLTAAGALADESALFPENFVSQMIGRCSIEDSKIFMNCNPQGPYHFMKDEYINKAAEKQILHLHFLLKDNLTLSEKIKERYKRMFSGVFYKRYILGLWVLAEGIIYDMWREDKHTIKYNQLPDQFDTFRITADYGTSNPTVFLLVGIKNGVRYIIDEYYWDSDEEGRQKTDAQYSNDMLDFINEYGYGIQDIVVDPSAASFITQLKSDLDITITKANNDVVDGIRKVATYLNTGKLYVVKKNCPNTIKEFASYVWDEKAQEKGEDKPVKKNDHALDGIRYEINTEPQIITSESYDWRSRRGRGR